MPAKETNIRIRKLKDMACKLSSGERYNITRLTIIKKMMTDLQISKAFSLHIARHTRDDLSRRKKKEDTQYFELINQAVDQMELTFKSGTKSNFKKLRDLHYSIKKKQNTYKNIPYGQLRIIISKPLITIEESIDCFLSENINNAGFWAYQLAKSLCDKYDGGFEGLNKKSLKGIQEIISFWECKTQK